MLTLIGTLSRHFINIFIIKNLHWYCPYVLDDLNYPFHLLINLQVDLINLKLASNSAKKIPRKLIFIANFIIGSNIPNTNFNYLELVDLAVIWKMSYKSMIWKILNNLLKVWKITINLYWGMNNLYENWKSGQLAFNWIAVFVLLHAAILSQMFFILKRAWYGIFTARY